MSWPKGYVCSPETYNKKYLFMRGEGNPAKRLSVRKKISKALTGHKHSVETIKKLSVSGSNFYKTPEGRKKIRNLSGKNHPTNRAEVRKNISVGRLRFWKTIRGKEQIKSMSGKNSFTRRTDVREHMSFARKGRTYEDLYGNKNAIKIKKERGLRLKKKWKCPKYRDRMRKLILKQGCEFPNKFEVRALVYLEKLYPRRFSYCGNGSILINGRSADAIDTKSRTVVLANGVYWHLK